MSADAMDRRAAIDHYLAAGLRLVAIPSGRKRPVETGWGDREYSRDELGAGSVGVILGPISGDLVDVDLDSLEALALAPAILPPTLTSGRASKPRSHRWYRSPGARLRQFRAPRPDGEMLLELRALPPNGNAAQTVLPPSIHESGERIEWDDDDGRDAVELPDAAVEIDAAELSERVTRLACAALVMRHCGEVLARRLLRDCAWPPLPEVVLARCREWLGILGKPPPRSGTPRGSDTVTRVLAYLRRVPPAISGQGGHAATFLVAQHLVLGFELDDDQALEAITEWNATCVPPWSERELEHKLRQARESGQTVSVGFHTGDRR